MEKRQPGLDLIRCTAFLFVLIFHSFLYNGFYYEPQTGWLLWLADSVRWLSVSCIGLFLMLTGYLRIDRTDAASCLRSLGGILSGYLIASVTSIPVLHFLHGDHRSLDQWISALVQFRGVYYGWYVEMYVGLILLSPFVNLALERIFEAGKLPGLLLVMGLLTALPGATPLAIAPDHWRVLYPVTYYLLGAAIRLYQPKLQALPCIGVAVLLSMGLGAVTVLSTDEPIGQAFTQEFGDLWICLICVCLFIGLYQFQGCERILAFGAGGCYGGYLLSHLFDAVCYKAVAPTRYPVLFLCVTVPIFFLCIALGNCLERLTGRKGWRR